MGGIHNTKAVMRARRLHREGKKRGQHHVDEYGLTVKQRRYCDTLLADPEENKRAAYEAAGYKSTDPNIISRAIAKIMRSPVVKAYLMTKREYLRKRTNIKQTAVVKELASIGFFDPADLFDDNGQLLNIHDIPQHARKAISGMDVVTEYAGRGSKRQAIGYTTKLKFVDKKGALDSLSRILGFFQQDGLDAEGVAQLMNLVAQSRGGSTIGRLGDGHLGSGESLSRSVVATQQPVLDSGQGRQVGPLQAQLGAGGAAGELLVHERDPEGEAAWDDDVHRHPASG